ncbi:hypothetical protein V8G54_017310 [Vigna mungo]|uniref:Uncharacterized protein n=1 Tax=Vigna mungo TaxID=3915 RepID=A0AAQ3NLN9_VIGMU
MSASIISLRETVKDFKTIAMFCDFLGSRRKAFDDGAKASLLELVELFSLGALPFRLVATTPKRASIRSSSTLQFNKSSTNAKMEESKFRYFQNLVYYDYLKEPRSILSHTIE